MTWTDLLSDEKQSPHFLQALGLSQTERSHGKLIYPAENQVFRAFELTPFDSVRVVLLGQDPYHGRGQAHGLCFSVPTGTPIPPSLHNIFKEIISDTGGTMPQHGNLEQWGHQGVLLLNSVLTVESGRPGSHAGRGWEQFTDNVITLLSNNTEHLVFLLWGNYAKRKESLIDTARHTILTAPHPSPFSAYQGFFGCRHFSQTNTDLIQHGLAPIDWNIY